MATTSPKRPLELPTDAVEEGPVTKKARVDEEEKPKRFRCVIVEDEEHDGTITHIVEGDRAGFDEFTRLLLDCKDFDDAYEVALTSHLLDVVLKNEPIDHPDLFGSAHRNAAAQEEYGKGALALQERTLALVRAYDLKAGQHAPHHPEVRKWILDVDAYLVIEGFY
jgi:hypothetical protein